MTGIPYQRFDGRVAAAPVMQSAGVGALAVTLAALGIVPLGFLKDGSPIWPMMGGANALATMQARDAKLKAREEALVAAAESADGDEAILAALAASADERAAIAAERASLAEQITIEAARRDRERSAPAADLPDGVDPSAALGASITPVATEAPKPFASFGEQLQAIRAAAIGAKNGADPDPRLRAVNEFARAQMAAAGLNETVGSDGGFAVQTDYSDRILARIDQDAVLWPAAFEIPVSTNANGVKVNLIDESSRATGSRWGGVQVYWEAEAAAGTAKKPKIFPLELTLQKLFGLAYRTDEIAQDWAASGAILEAAFSAEMAFALDDAALRGTGAGQPTGILNSSALVSVSGESGQTADTVIAENIFNMFARMPARSKRRAAWYINGDLWPQIFQLHQVIGTGGAPLFIPTGAIGDAPGGTLLGRPVIEIEQASAPGDTGDINFIDMGEYLRISKGGIQRASSIHVEFLTDQEVFRWILRTNGAPGWKTAVTPYKGSLSKSPFVTLSSTNR
jgi:HK97 family phage major capsid protein